MKDLREAVTKSNDCGDGIMMVMLVAAETVAMLMVVHLYTRPWSLFILTFFDIWGQLLKQLA